MKLDAYGNIHMAEDLRGRQLGSYPTVRAIPDGGYAGLRVHRFLIWSGNGAGWCLKVDSTGDIDPSCANLVQTHSTYGRRTSPCNTTSVLGNSHADIPNGNCHERPSRVDSTATMTVICSGGTDDGPTITSITSRTSKVGSPATIKGTGFSTTKTKNVVYFGTKKVTTIRRAKATSLTGVIIPRVKKGMVDVYVVVDGEKSNVFKFQVK